jgi:hypothetical protein
METQKPALIAGAKVAAIIPNDIEQVFRLAKAVAVARWAPKGYMIDPKRADLGYDEARIVVGIMHGLEVGLTPIAALQSIAVINGVPSIFGDGALAVVQASGLMEDFVEEPLFKDNKVIGYRCTARRRGMASPISHVFTLDDAQRAHLLDKPGPWQEYRTRMLQMRARAWTLRAGFADVLRGMSIAEEAQDITTITQQTEQPARTKRASEVLDVFAGAGSQPTNGDSDAGCSGDHGCAETKDAAASES